MSADDVSAVFAERISARLVDLKTGELLDKDPAKFNQALALKDPQMSLTLEASQDPAGLSVAATWPKSIWFAIPKNAFRKWYCLFTVTVCGQ